MGERRKKWSSQSKRPKKKRNRKEAVVERGHKLSSKTKSDKLINNLLIPI